MCCHRALTSSSAIALTPRAVGGLTTSEIANAYQEPESTVAERISDAKETIKAPLATTRAIQRRLPADREVAALLTRQL